MKNRCGQYYIEISSYHIHILIRLVDSKSLFLKARKAIQISMPKSRAHAMILISAATARRAMIQQERNI